MRVRWLRKALSNVAAEAEFIAQDNPLAARQVVQRIFDSVEQLRDNPSIGRPGRISGTRELVVAGTRYIVPYRVRGDLIEVLR
ncbi:MAG: type II toxin-antitoxin system RelE/ParE family toxin, partial [Thiotrichales bacterium]